MDYLFKVQKKIVPEVIELAEVRYSILKKIYHEEPIGRRSLSEGLNLSVRQVRNELEFLNEQGLIKVSRAGVSLTQEGKDFITELELYFTEIKDFANLEKKVEEKLGINEVLIVPCNLEHSNLIREIGRVAANYLRRLLRTGDIIAITGGYTMSQVAEMMPFCDERYENTIVVPGRGGLGEEVDIQANTIAASIAKKIGGKYYLLQVPDNLKVENISLIKDEPSIQKTLNILGKANILVHGVGNAAEMSARRGMDQSEIDDILSKGAIGEAFGYYCNLDGEIVYSTPSIGLSLEEVENIGTVIAVAGGEKKAEAIKSIISPKYQDVLITDEETARRIISL
ncbi:sugar-binding transcriptional regulator [Halanaerobiaceae bacterium Z-7014]|uniref:Sugar-binding transcriptional regulator n=1 Tax=Halonatronomonas betaini TaxID=2778430 RepID=A0A931ARY9_9FIRM|nr:sugar-binding transcriptional regulator [Halonatronomonas betaini]